MVMELVVMGAVLFFSLVWCRQRTQTIVLTNGLPKPYLGLQNKSRLNKLGAVMVRNYIRGRKESCTNFALLHRGYKKKNVEVYYIADNEFVSNWCKAKTYTGGWGQRGKIAVGFFCT
jgi:hypothetical protein